MATKKTLVGKIDASVLKFTVGQDRVLDLALAEADCIGTAAHATMLARVGVKPRIFTQAQLKRVIAALVATIRQARRGTFDISYRDQDVHLAVERVLTNKLGTLGKRVHTARSRNDQVALDLRLYAKDKLLSVASHATALAEALLSFASMHKTVPMVGRTHLQPAMPSSVGLWASAYAEGLVDDMTVWRAAYDVNNRSPLGSAAGYGVSLPIDRALTAKLLGFPAPIHNVLHAANARGKCETVILSALTQIMLTVSRLAEDLILYAMPEFGYFRIPDAFCTGSSIMPQKRNPDVLELIRSKAARVVGDTTGALGIMTGLPGGYNRDLQEIKEVFMHGFQTTEASLIMLTLLVGSLSIDKAALLKGFTADVFAADRALQLTERGVPFRDAYQTVKESLGDGEAVDPRKAVLARAHLGAPGGLDLPVIKTGVRDVKRFVSREQTSYCSAVARLLGVPYPALK